jgi:hypothetical protein
MNWAKQTTTSTSQRLTGSRRGAATDTDDSWG